MKILPLRHSLGAGLAALLLGPALGQWSTDTLSQARTDLAATTVGSEALFAGGLLQSGAQSTRVDIFDAVAGAWRTAELSQSRFELAAASANGFALFAGGRKTNVVSDRVDVYDSATGQWSTASLSLARRSAAAASVGGKILFAGGSPTTHFDSSDVVDVFDASAGTWSTAALSHARADHAAAVVGSLAIFAGDSDFVEIYDAATDTWSSSSHSIRRTRLAATSVGRLALFAGGDVTPGTSHHSTDMVDVYDSATQSWSSATLSQPRSRLTATTIGDLAIFAGGQIGSPPFSNRVDVYDASTGIWTIATLAWQRRGLAATTVGNLAFFGGGRGNAWSDVLDVFDAGLGASYCSPATANSTGMPAHISAIGSPWVASNDITLMASGLPPGEFGYFLVGSSQGAFQPPGSQGTICLTCAGFQGCAGIGRYNRASEIVQGPSGSLQVDLGALPLGPPVAVQPGETWNFQCWFRDLGSNNFTDAVSVRFL